MRKSLLIACASLLMFSVQAQQEVPTSVVIKSAIPGQPDAVMTVVKETRPVQSMFLKQGKHNSKKMNNVLEPTGASVAANGCDTVTNINPLTDTVLTTWNFGTLGFLGGTFSFTNKQPKWAEYFINTSPSTWIQNVEMTFTNAGYSNPSNTFKVTLWDNNGTAGAPGTVWASYNVPYKTISDWIINFNGAVRVTISFNSPVSINGNPTFFVGTECDTLTPDTLATAWTQNLFNMPGRSNSLWTNVTNNWTEVRNIFTEQSSGNPLWVNGFTRVGVTQFPISASPTPLTDTICANTAVNYTSNNTTNVVSYQWTFNGGSPTTSTSANPSPSYNVPGVYWYQYRAYNQCGMYNSHLGQITVLTLPTINATTSADTLCIGQTASLNATGGVSYTWAGGSINGNTGASQAAVISGTTTFVVTGTGSNTCTNQDSVTVVVPGLVTANAISNPATNVCINTPVTFGSSGSTNANAFLWYIPGSSVPTSTQSSPQATYSTPGPKTISLVASNMCYSDSTAIQLTVDTCWPAGIEDGRTYNLSASTDGYGLYVVANGFNGQQVDLQMIDMQGRAILESQVALSEGRQYIGFIGKPATGVYLIRIVSDDRQWTFKSFIK